jgi:hypothetical protein
LTRSRTRDDRLGIAFAQQKADHPGYDRMIRRVIVGCDKL